VPVGTVAVTIKAPDALPGDWGKIGSNTPVDGSIFPYVTGVTYHVTGLFAMKV